MGRATAKRGGKKGWGDSPELRSYLDESQRPIVILAFLAPAIIIYQLGSQAFKAEIVAFALLRDTMAYLGVYGRSVPAILLVLTLLGWHLVKRDRWQFQTSTLAKMLVESLLMALPVFAIGILAQHFVPLMARGNPHLGANLALSLGAGLYEELVFRVYLCGLLWLIIGKGLGVSRLWATVMVVLISAVLFSAYHYLGREAFVLHVFVFRVLAGAFFAALYMTRGLGVTAGAHAIYDVIVVGLGGF